MLPRHALNCFREETQEAAADEPAVWCPNTPHVKQVRFLELECEEALYGGAAGGGKSDALLMAALQYVHVPEYAALIMRRTFAELRLEDALMDRARKWLAGTSARWEAADMRWRFPSGATLTFGYLNEERDKDRYQSAAWHFIGMDELTHWEEKQYRFMFSRIRRKTDVPVPLRMRSATNPGGVGHKWVKDRWGIPEEVDFAHVYEHQGRTFIPARRVDNPSLDQDSYSAMLAKLDPATRAQLDDGRWVQDASGLVYYCFSRSLNTVGGLPELPEGEQWSRILGCDFGVRDPTAFVELAFTAHDPNVYVTRSEQWVDLPPSDAAREAQAWESAVGGYDAIVGDIGGMGAGWEVEWRKRFYYPMRTAKKTDKLGYIKLINGDLHHRKLLVLPGNDQLVTDLEELRWKTEEARQEHPGLPNHLPDALLYGWREARHWLFEERPPPPPIGAELAKQQSAKRKERIKQRTREWQDGIDGTDDQWIWGDGSL